MIDDLHDELVADRSGAYSLRDKEFKDEVFNRISISPDSRFGDYEIANLSLVGCSVSNGRFSVYGASRLTNVNIVSLECDQYSFHADNRLDNVSISGGAGSMLWLREPLTREGRRIDGVTLRHPTSPDGVCLDISGYLGEVEIQHADPRNIRINPEIHVVCERARLETVDWRNDAVLSEPEFVAVFTKALLSATGVYIGSIIDRAGKIDVSFDAAVAELRRREVVD